MSRPMDHPPNPRGATGRELGIVTRLHRAALLCDDDRQQPAIVEGLDLLVSLIESRDRRQAFLDHFDRPHDD